MKISIKNLGWIVLCMVSASQLCIADNRESSNVKRMVLNAKGESEAYLCTIPSTTLGTTQALCFDVPLYDMKKNRYVGTMQDALADVQSSAEHPGALIATATSTFTFYKRTKSSSFTTRVLGQVQPFLQDNDEMTHMTSYYSTPNQNDIIAATGRFQNKRATARESGSINLSQFTGQPGDIVTYDLLWIIEFFE